MSYAESLYQKIWKTKGTRFIAHKRLEILNQFSIYAISLNSIYVIILSLLSMSQFNKYSKLNSDLLSIITLFLSILIIVISIIENSKNYKAKAESHHQCGKDLNKIYERLIQIKDSYDVDKNSKAEIDQLGLDYQKIIDKYPENHSSIDFKKFLIINKQNPYIKYTNFHLLIVWFELFLPMLATIFIPLLIILFYVIKLSGSDA